MCDRNSVLIVFLILKIIILVIVPIIVYILYKKEVFIHSNYKSISSPSGSPSPYVSLFLSLSIATLMWSIKVT